MHKLHDTVHGTKAISFKFDGELGDEMEPRLRMEFDKTLVRERTGGVILDMSSVTKLGGTIIARTSSLAASLHRDGIRFIIVLPHDIDCAALMMGVKGRFGSVTSTAKDAKALLGIIKN